MNELGPIYESLGGAKARIDALEKTVATLQATVARLSSGASNGAPSQATNGAASTEGPAVASAQDLDGQYGNPEVRFNPKDRWWTGESYVGRRFSDCPSDYLEAMAKGLEAAAWGAEKGATEKPEEAERSLKKAHFKRLDAARARGWAARNRNKPAAPAGGGGSARAPVDDFSAGAGDDDIPFIHLETRQDRP